MAKRIVLLLVALASLGALLPSARSQAAALVQLSGKVAGQSGTPLAAATVAALTAGGSTVASTTSGDDGRYALSLAAGTYDIQVTPPAGSAFQASTIRNRVIEGDTTLDVVLVPFNAERATLTGRITDGAGQPLANQQLQLSSENGAARAESDSSGQYRISVTVGSYSLEVSGGHVQPDGSWTAYHLRSYGLSLQQDRVLNIALPEQRVTVQVQDTAGAPVGDVIVEANGASYNDFVLEGVWFHGQAQASARTPASGEASLLLFPTSDDESDDLYTFVATPPEGRRLVPARLRDIRVTTAALTVTMTLASLQLVTLSGQLTDGAGQPLAEQQLQLRNENSTTNTKSDSSGYYEMSVPIGSYSLEVSGGHVQPDGSWTAYHLWSWSLNLQQDRVLDIALPEQQVTVQVQDTTGAPVSDVTVDANGASYTDFLHGGVWFHGQAQASARTSASGEANLLLFPTSDDEFANRYTFVATPPEGRPLVPARLRDVRVTTAALTVTMTLAPLQLVTLSGQLTDGVGQPLANQQLQLSSENGAARAESDSSGQYHISVTVGSYSLEVSGGHVQPDGSWTAYHLRSYNLNLQQDRVLDIALPEQRVTVQVQDTAGAPVGDVIVEANGASYNDFVLEGVWFHGQAQASARTSASGEASLLLFPTSDDEYANPYTFVATPINTSAFTIFRVRNVEVTGDQELVFILQFVHAPPVTTASIATTPYAPDTYAGPVAVTLAASAAAGSRVATTYYRVDGGAQQIYSGPFTVSGFGAHTVSYWSIDDAGVYEAPRTLAFTIAAPTPTPSDTPAPPTATHTATPSNTPTQTSTATATGTSTATPSDTPTASTTPTDTAVTTSTPTNTTVATSAPTAPATATAAPSSAPTLRIATGSPLPGGTVDEPYAAQLAAEGGLEPYTWSLDAGELPPGLRLDERSGLISGTPTTAGTFRFTVRVTDSSAVTVVKQFSFAPPPPPGDAGAPYTLPIAITPPTPEPCLSYTILEGALPPGLTIDPSTGVISGTPEDGGTYTFTVVCVTQSGQTATQEFSVTIENPRPIITRLSPATLSAGSAGATIVVEGSGFVRSSQVRWNGMGVAATFDSSRRLTVTIPAAMLANPGVGNVEVVNAGPGGGASGAWTVTIVAAPAGGTKTPKPTSTPKPTNTPKPTSTPRPTTTR